MVPNMLSKIYNIRRTYRHNWSICLRCFLCLFNTNTEKPNKIACQTHNKFIFQKPILIKWDVLLVTQMKGLLVSSNEC